MKKFTAFLNKKSFMLCVIMAFILNFIMETLGRHSIIGCFNHIIHEPHIFLYNVLLILLSLSIALLFKRRLFALSILTVIWLTFGLTNFIVLGSRSTPFTASDFFIVKAALNMMGIYLSKWQIGGIILLFIASVAGVILLWKKAPKQQIYLRKSLMTIAVLCISVAISTGVGVKTQILAKNFDDIAEAYTDYGFVYCFSMSVLEKGIDKPENYSKEAVDQVLKDMEYKSKPTAKSKPNIIFLQLESFIDLKNLKNSKYGSDIVPVFTSLKENGTSGYLGVSTVGGGTANTEFEILTGMNLDFFGPSEYPYETVLRDKKCESLVSNLRALGYSAHAIHNYIQNFYDRDIVYDMLGFDSYTPIECMEDIDYNELGWARDKVLVGEIMSTLKATKEKDFIFAVSVQGHGKYPEGNEFDYYVSQINDMDSAVGELINLLKEFDEETVLVVYGDHMPDLDISKEQLINNDIYETEYAIWSNFELPNPKPDADLEAYMLNSYVLEQCGIQSGAIGQLQIHSRNNSDKNFESNLKLFQYDILYGERYIYNGMSPYKTNTMSILSYKSNIHKPLRVNKYIEQSGNTKIWK